MTASPPGCRRARRMMLTVCAMTATIMQALDTTVANVALPYMQGSLSASLDQINWVLTSYIVASAIMTAPIGWMSDRFGRNACLCLLRRASPSPRCCAAGAGHRRDGFLAALAGRVRRGAGSAFPVRHARAFPLEERGMAMSIWGMGVMLGPILGPTIGGWLTDLYSWHWVFLINFPVGIFTVLGLILFMDETRKQDQMRFDWIGFFALAVGIGSLQLVSIAANNRAGSVHRNRGRV